MVLAVAVPALAADTTAPVVSFVTPTDSVLVSNPAAQQNDTVPLEVKGTATDNSAGIAEVWATWIRCDVPPSGSSCTTISNAQPTTTPVALSCNSTRRSCTWRAAAATVPGFYFVYGQARDRSNNVSAFNRYIRVRVV